jgi:lipopolysaccharide/colanic/teichoic acid biosynthesis glycosyltransferase
MYKDNDDSQYREFIRKFTLGETNQGKDLTISQINNPRTTPVGAVLRKTNLDELPQLLNIINGDMSFIGPRPDTPYATEMYRPRHMKRLGVKPGIMGLWQVSRRRQTSFEEMVDLDLEYIEKRSLLLDIKIMLKTIIVILRREH